MKSVAVAIIVAAVIVAAAILFADSGNKEAECFELETQLSEANSDGNPLLMQDIFDRQDELGCE